MKSVFLLAALVALPGLAIEKTQESISSNGPDRSSITFSTRSGKAVGEIVAMTEAVFDKVAALGKISDVPGGKQFKCLARIGRLTTDGVQVFSLDSCEEK